jgi:flagellar biosynthetic protein FlhB
VLGLPIFHQPQLARALYAGCEKGAEVPQEQYRAVADLYVRLGRASADRSDHAGD